MEVRDTAEVFLAQALPPPDLEGLPPWAQVLGYAVFALSIVGVGLVTRFGWKMGRSSPPSTGADSKTATVAAVIVDPEALNRASAAVLKLEGTLSQLRDLVGQFVADQREEREEREFDEEVQRRVKEELKLQQPSRRRPRRPESIRTPKS